MVLAVCCQLIVHRPYTTEERQQERSVHCEDEIDVIAGLRSGTDDSMAVMLNPRLDDLDLINYLPRMS